VSSPGEKLLAGEMLAGLTLTAIARIWAAAKSGSPAPTVPAPHEFLGVAMLYGGLALVALFGPQPARLAAGVGALVLLAIALKASGEVFQAVGVPGSALAQPAGNPGQGVQAI
jgi:hypothetical protein